MKMKGVAPVMIASVLIIVVILAAGIYVVTRPTEVTDGEEKLFEGITITMFTGGAEGDPWSTGLYNGAVAAEELLGCDVEYIFSDWDAEKMVSQFEDAIAREPDGIVMMGHPGYGALASLVDEAQNKGIYVTFTNVDISEIREKYHNCGYVGPKSWDDGYGVGKKCVEEFDLKLGDRAAIFSGSWENPPRIPWTLGCENALKEAGVIVDRVEHAPAVYVDVALGIPIVTGYVGAHPDAKLLVFDGGGTTSAVKTYMEHLGIDPGEIKCAGRGSTEGALESMKAGYLQVIEEHQRWLEGFLPIVNCCLSVKYRFSGLYIHTGGQFLTQEFLEEIEDLVEAGIR